MLLNRLVPERQDSFQLSRRYPVQDTHEPRLKVKDENVGWKHTCSACSHAGFERIGSRSGYNPVQDIYILQRPSSCDPHFRYSDADRVSTSRAIASGPAPLCKPNRKLKAGSGTDGAVSCSLICVVSVSSAQSGFLFLDEGSPHKC